MAPDTHHRITGLSRTLRLKQESISPAFPFALLPPDLHSQVATQLAMAESHAYHSKSTGQGKMTSHQKLIKIIIWGMSYNFYIKIPNEYI